MLPEQNVRQEANTIIRMHALLSAGTGFIPIMGIDIVASSAIQTDMIWRLCNLYGVNFEDNIIQALMTAVSSAAAASIVTLGVEKALHANPGFSTITGIFELAGNSLVAGASTFATGEVLKAHFEAGGTLENLQTEQFIEYYQDKIGQGFHLVNNWESEIAKLAEGAISTGNKS